MSTDGKENSTSPPADDGSVALFERLGLPLTVIGRDGVVLTWNDRMAEVLGWTAAEAVGREALALGVAPADTDKAVDATGSAFRQGLWRGRMPVTAKDGSRVMGTWLVTRADGRVLAVLVDWERVDEGEAAGHAAAEEANLLLEGMLQNAPVALAIFDRGLRYVRANGALAEINGMRPEEHVGVPLPTLFPELAEVVGPLIQQVFETGEPVVDQEVVTDTPGRPGEVRTFRIGYFPIALRGEVRWVGAAVVDETERLRLLEGEHEARRRAERTAEQLTRLQQLTALLSGARSRDEVCEVLVREGVGGAGAGTAVLCLLTDDGDELEIVRQVGLSPDVSANWARFPLDMPVPVADAVRTRRPVLFSSLEERDRLYPALAGQPASNEAYATMPLVLGGRVLGSVTFGWREPKEFTEEDRRFLLALAEQCAQALDRCRLAAADTREQRRKAFVAEAGAVLASSLDYETTIERVARMVLPELADACAVHAVGPHGLELLTVAHVDPAHEELLLRLGQDLSIIRAMRLDEVAESRRPLLVESVGPEAWHAAARDDQQRVQLQRLGLSSGLAVPLLAGGQCLGVLSLAMSVSGRRYGAEDVDVAKELAERAAVAIQNARSHRALRDVASTLQRSLLPSASPAIPGLDVAAVYRPVSDSEVGGDFYDVFPVGPGRWGVVVGDVCGKGVQAASLTALARYTVRAAAVGAASPSAVLARLNQAVLDEGADDRFCTIAHLMVEPADGEATVTLACGGHPLPYLVSADGSLRPIGLPGSGIGMFPDPDLVDTVHTLGPGDALVLYTDGVLEARSPEGAFDPDLFVSSLAAAAKDARSAQELADAVAAAVLDFEGGHPRDDMAVLVLRVPEPG